MEQSCVGQTVCYSQDAQDFPREQNALDSIDKNSMTGHQLNGVHHSYNLSIRMSPT